MHVTSNIQCVYISLICCSTNIFDVKLSIHSVWNLSTIKLYCYGNIIPEGVWSYWLLHNWISKMVKIRAWQMAISNKMVHKVQRNKWMEQQNGNYRVYHRNLNFDSYESIFRQMNRDLELNSNLELELLLQNLTLN